MASLSDQIDRLARNTRAIRSTASCVASSSSSNHSISYPASGPFTRAVLQTHLGDLIRDIDPSELGLFSLVNHPTGGPYDKEPHNTYSAEIQRVEFSGATPLRRPPARREDQNKYQDIEPEVYAQAALKYIDRYEPIRSMPRAHVQVLDIIKRLDAVRFSISQLSEALQHARSFEAPSTKSVVESEENRVQELQRQLSDLKTRKQTIMKKRANVRAQSSDHKSASEAISILSPTSPQEDKFWNTPRATSETLEFTDHFLMDEQVDLGDISTISFTSPMSRPPSVRRETVTTSSDKNDDVEEDHFPRDIWEQKRERITEKVDDHDSGREPKLDPHNGEEDVFGAGEQSIAMVPGRNTSAESLIPSVTPVIGDHNVSGSPGCSGKPENRREGRIKVTNEVERIVSKIWATIGEVVMPGHSFDTPGASKFKNKPPSAKETIAHLQRISKISPLMPSPSASSVSTVSSGGRIQPTSQQILTAHLLVSLLSSPEHSMPLQRAKEILAERATNGRSTAGGLSQGTTRVLYGCVAKRLVKIDRGGGEQIVKFDI